MFIYHLAGEKARKQLLVWESIACLNDETLSWIREPQNDNDKFKRYSCYNESCYVHQNSSHEKRQYLVLLIVSKTKIISLLSNKITSI
jgi:hypothetical protein